MKKPTTVPHEKLAKIYLALGKAMTEWQRTEMALTQLFSILVSAEGGVASAVFNSVTSLQSKLSMVEAAAAVRLKDTPDLLNECIELCKNPENETNLPTICFIRITHIYRTKANLCRLQRKFTSALTGIFRQPFLMAPSFGSTAARCQARMARCIGADRDQGRCGLRRPVGADRDAGLAFRQPSKHSPDDRLSGHD